MGSFPSRRQPLKVSTSRSLQESYGPKSSSRCAFRPIGARYELARLPKHPIVYPALSEAYAVNIARDWNVPASGKGCVTRFLVAKMFLDRYQIQQAGGKDHREYWIAAEDLASFNDAIIGQIEVIAEFE